MPFGRELLQHRMALEHDDRRSVVVAEQHRLDINPTGVDRGNRKQNQRHGDDPRRFLGRPVLLGVRVRFRAGGRRCVVPVRLFVIRPRKALAAVEGEEEQPERIKRGDEDADRHGEIRVAVPRNRREMHRLDDRVLRKESRERRDARKRKRADDCRDPRDRHVLRKSTHLAHVLLVMERDDHRPRAQEQERFEKRVRRQVEDRRRIRRHAERDRHVAQLRQR